MTSTDENIESIECEVPQTDLSVETKQYFNPSNEIDLSDDFDHSKMMSTFGTSLYVFFSFNCNDNQHLFPRKTYLLSLSCSTIIGIGLALLTTVTTIVSVPILYSFKQEETLTSMLLYSPHTMHN